jgi:hypothetical protein
VAESLLRLRAIVALDAAVNSDDGTLMTAQGCDASLEIVEGVSVLGEDDQLLRGRGDRLGRLRNAGMVDRAFPAEALRITADVKISPISVARSRHFLSSPLLRIAAARASSSAGRAMSMRSSAAVWAAVA